MSLSETGTLPAARPFELVGLETLLRLRAGDDRVHRRLLAEQLLTIGPPRPGWPEDFRLPHMRNQGIA